MALLYLLPELPKGLTRGSAECLPLPEHITGRVWHLFCESTIRQKQFGDMSPSLG